MILSYLQDVKEGRTGFGNGVAEINAWISSAVPAVDWSIQKDCWSLGKTVRGRSEPIGRKRCAKPLLTKDEREEGAMAETADSDV